MAQQTGTSNSARRSAPEYRYLVAIGAMLFALGAFAVINDDAFSTDEANMGYGSDTVRYATG